MGEIEHYEYLKSLDHHYAVRGESADIGRIRTGNDQADNSTKIKEQKRQKQEQELRHILETHEALAQFQDILDQMKVYLDELEELKRQSKLARQLIQNGDIEGSIDFLIQYHNLRPDDLALMSDSEIMAVMMNIEGQNQDNIERLKSEIKTLAHEAYLIMGEHFDANNPEHQKLMNRLEDMESRAKNLNTDLNQIVKDTLIESENKYSLLQQHINLKTNENLFLKTKTITEKFNLIAQNSVEFKKEHDNSFSSSNDQPSKVIGMNL